MWCFNKQPLLTVREGLEQLVDPSLAGNCDFDNVAKVATIASMCVHPKVTHRPFMGEVVQALKLIYNDKYETCGDCCSKRESSGPDLDLRGDLDPSYSSWWNVVGITPHLTYGLVTLFITMEYSSGPLEEMENKLFSASSLVGKEVPLQITHENKSGPLRTIRSSVSSFDMRFLEESHHRCHHHHQGRTSEDVL